MFKTFTINTDNGDYYISVLIDKNTNKCVMPALMKYTHDGHDIYVSDNVLWLNKLLNILNNYINLESYIEDKILITKQFNEWFNIKSSKDDIITFTYDTILDLQEILTEAKTLNII